MLVKSSRAAPLRRHAAVALAVLGWAGLAVSGLVSAHAAEPDPEPRVVVESVELVEVSSLTTWFGGAAAPTLELVLYNNGQSAFVPTVELEWRDGNGPANAVRVPEVPELAPGTRATVEVLVQFESFAQGQHSVTGVVRAGGRESGIEATARLVPWGLYGLLVVALLAASALRTRWVMSQLDRDETDETAEERAPRTAAPSPAAAGPVLVGPAPLPTTAPTPAEVEARALATMERFVGTREQQKRGVESDAESDAGAGLTVPEQRAPSGGRRAERARKASTPWLTRR